MKRYFTTIGQDSHRVEIEKNKPLILGGIEFDADFSLAANSDGDVVLHALTNAVSSATTYNVLGKVADEMCKSGITDSKEYLKEAMSATKDMEIEHVSISIEALKPKLSPKINPMREEIASLLNISTDRIGITATTGEGLTEFGKGNGIFVTVLLSCSKEEKAIISKI